MSRRNRGIESNPFEAALRLFETMEKLVIVGMHGYCLGGALQLSLAADIRVSTTDCRNAPSSAWMRRRQNGPTWPVKIPSGNNPVRNAGALLTIVFVTKVV